jgi:hypothetical protein
MFQNLDVEPGMFLPHSRCTFIHMLHACEHHMDVYRTGHVYMHKYGKFAYASLHQIAGKCFLSSAHAAVLPMLIALACSASADVQSTPQGAAAAHASGQQQQQQQHESATPFEQQAAIIKHLQALADAEAAELDAAAAVNVDSSATQQAVLNLDQMTGSTYSSTDNSMEAASAPILVTGPAAPTKSPATDLTDSSSSSRDETAASAPAVVPNSQVQRNLTFLQSSKLKLGLDLKRLGAVSWLSSSLIPEPWTNRNLINVYDQGR